MFSVRQVFHIAVKISLPFDSHFRSPQSYFRNCSGTEVSNISLIFAMFQIW